MTTPQVSDASATVRVRSTVENHLDAGTQVMVMTTLLDPDGKPIGRAGSTEDVPAGGSRDVEQTIAVTNPQRWDIHRPKLYTARVLVRAGGKVMDTDTTSFGIRTFQFTANDGFHLNGRRVQLYGVCLHHDQGPLGGAFYPRAMERQLEIMRDMGVNAIRTSHNPPAPELLDLCDRMGFVVWDEAFDKWDGTADRVKGEPPLQEYGEKQLRNFVMRDRNHPSIVVWSIGNEIGGGGRDGITPERVKFMSDFVRKYDPTRPVGMGCHIPGLAEQPNFDALDLTGWNYMRRYATYRQRYPDKPIVYSESASALSTRGFYELPLPNRKNEYSKQLQVNSYDLNAADWSDIPDSEFKLMKDDSFVAGEFVWTGFDYLGEPTPFSQEAKSSYFGIVDLCGIPKDRFYLYRSYWRPDTATVHILPHWNWPDRVGQNVPVFVYTNGDSAELFLNGKSLGRRQKGVVPAKPENFAKGKPATASSNQPEHAPAHANDGGMDSRWTAVASRGQSVVAGGPGRGSSHPLPGHRLRAGREELRLSDQGLDRCLHVADRRDKAHEPQPPLGRPDPDLSRYGCEGPVCPHRVHGDAQRRLGQHQGIRRLPPARGVGVLRCHLHVSAALERCRLRAGRVEGGRLQGRPADRRSDDAYGGKARVDSPDPGPQGSRRHRRRPLLRSRRGLDDKGTLCPLADNLVRFKVEGPAEIAAVGNGNPLSLEPFQADYRKLFYGKAMLILRTKEGQAGPVHVTATSDGLTAAETVVSVLNP